MTVTYKLHPAAELFPLMAEDELLELANDIGINGLIEPVWLYRDAERGEVLLDGRNRLRACDIAGVKPRTQYYSGDNPVGFSISRNVLRRHLSTGKRAAVAFKALPLFEAEAKRRMLAGVKDPEADLPQGKATKRRQGERTDLKPENNIGADRHQGKATKRKPQARDNAAKMFGTSGRSVAQYKRIYEQAPELAVKVEDDEITLNRAERIIRNREAEQKLVAEARSEVKEKTRVDIRHGDFREVLADISGVNAIITDPPYPKEYLPLLADLASWADRVLTPDGILAVLMGQTHLPEVYRLLSGYRPYRWTACYLTLGSGYVSHPRKVQSNWKPLLVYGGGPRFADVIKADMNDKSYHKWGQNYGAFHTIVERLTKRGQTVCDPFCGGGTTLLAAHAQGRHVIGCDLDEASIATSRERLK